jgi:hypothetical protein
LISFIIPFRSDEPERIRSFQFIYSTLVKDWPNDEVIIAEGSWEHEPFSRTKARNFGAKNANGDILVFVDADSWVSKDSLDMALEHVEEEGWFLPYDTYYSLSKEGTEAFYDGCIWDPVEDSLYVFPDPDHPFDRPEAIGGCIMMTRAAFETVHGYDERFEQWGWEDTSFVAALETLVGGRGRVIGPLFHLWHPSVEQDCFNHQDLEYNRALYHRYLRAQGDQGQMRALVQEH